MRLNDVKDLFPRFNVDTFEHVAGHVSKAAGKIHGLIGDADHIAERYGREGAFAAAEFANVEVGDQKASAYIADLIICAAKLAALCPSGEIDLEEAVAARMAEKRDYLRQYDERAAR
jgi:hypothetical protein